MQENPFNLGGSDLLLPSIHCEISYEQWPLDGQLDNQEGVTPPQTQTSVSSTQVQNRHPKWNEMIQLMFTNQSLGLEDPVNDLKKPQTSLKKPLNEEEDDDDEIDRGETVNLKNFEGGSQDGSAARLDTLN